MKKVRTKEAAEAILRELPSVRGAFVREDVNGHPREVHILVGPGPEPRLLARDIRDLLEERLGVPVDQRVISIAQLSERIDQIPIEEIAGPRPGEAGHAAANGGDSAGADRAAPAARATGTHSHGAGTTGPDSHGAGTTGASTATAGAPTAAGATVRPAPAAPADATPARLVFEGLESTTRNGRTRVCVRVSWGGNVFEGTAEEIDGGTGRARATAAATLLAATRACEGRMHLELEAASIVHALGRDYVLVSALAISPLLGRRPVPLAGAHPRGDGDEAAALAALQASNRVLTLALRR
ncbi:MAG TPA: hypothetical protein VF158_03965 [Longimicrobiales bacterium]